MASRRKLAKRFKVELWVMSRVGIPKQYTLASRKVQDVRIAGFTLTIGEARLIQKLLTGGAR